MQATVRTHEGYADPTALTRFEGVGLAVRTTASTGSILLVTRAVTDTDLHGYTLVSACFPSQLSAA